MPFLRHRRASGLSATLALAVVGSRSTHAVASDSDPKGAVGVDLKAVLLLHFAEFVEWPSEAFPNRDAPIVIGILGDDPFGARLDDVVANEVRERKLSIQRFHDPEDVGLCHILYVSGADPARIAHVLSVLKGRSILTVGESADFTALQGIVRFVVADRKLHLEINTEAARAAKLEIRSKLLRQASIVDGAGSP